MGISAINHYGGSDYYGESKVNKSGKREEKIDSRTRSENASRAESFSGSKNTQAYLEDLQKRNPEINIISGDKDVSRKKSSNSKTDVMIAPSILNQMASDPEAAEKYEKMLADIPALNKWADSMIHALTGSEVKYRQVWIDDNGNMGSFVITGPGEETKRAEEQARKQEEEEYHKRINERKEKYREFMERLERKRKEPMESVYLDSIKKSITVDYNV